jgi:hypothetical protein
MVELYVTVALEQGIVERWTYLGVRNGIRQLVGILLQGMET